MASTKTVAAISCWYGFYRENAREATFDGSGYALTAADTAVRKNRDASRILSRTSAQAVCGRVRGAEARIDARAENPAV